MFFWDEDSNRIKELSNKVFMISSAVNETKSKLDDQNDLLVSLSSDLSKLKISVDILYNSLKSKEKVKKTRKSKKEPS